MGREDYLREIIYKHGKDIIVALDPSSNKKRYIGERGRYFRIESIVFGGKMLIIFWSCVYSSHTTIPYERLDGFLRELRLGEIVGND